MTYIKQIRRDAIQPFITALVNKAKQSGATKSDLSFMMSEIALGVLRPNTGWTYETIYDAIDVLRGPADEITRRCLGGFADAAAHVNGDNPNMAIARQDILDVYNGILDNT